jgi:hypothetical protein
VFANGQDFTSWTHLEPMFVVKLSGVFWLRAETRYR